VHSIPRDVSEPLVSLDFFGIIRIHATTSDVLVVTRARAMIFGLVTLGTKAMVLLLDYTSDEILTSPADGWLGREGKCRLVALLRS